MSHDHSDTLALVTRSISLALVLGLAACTSKDDFVERVEPKVVALLCDQQRPAEQLPIYYRKCFDVDEARCVAVMTRHVHTCAGKIVRDKVDERNAGALTERIGACAGTDYELELERQGKRIQSEACDIARDAYASARAAVKP